MELLPDELRTRLPPLLSQEAADEPHRLRPVLPARHALELVRNRGRAGR